MVPQCLCFATAGHHGRPELELQWRDGGRWMLDAPLPAALPRCAHEQARGQCWTPWAEAGAGRTGSKESKDPFMLSQTRRFQCGWGQEINAFAFGRMKCVWDLGRYRKEKSKKFSIFSKLLLRQTFDGFHKTSRNHIFHH